MAGNALKVLDKPDATALGEMIAAELDKQIATAKKYARDEVRALRELETLATRSDPVAESCMYTLKRKDKDGTIVWITGPSVRFAELLAYCWGNLRAGARIIEEGEKAVVAQGVAYDLQRNTGLMLEVRRNIMTSSGHRFGNDMINVTSNAACSIALRNVIFDCVPQVLWWDVYEIVKHKAVGAAQIPQRIQQAVKFFVDKGAKQEDILAALGVKAIDEMGRDHLEIFIGLRTALKEGGIEPAKIFTAEGKEQRAKLNLVSEEEEQFNSIDKQLAGGGAKTDGGPKAAASEAPGGSSQGGRDRGKGKGAKAKADTADKGKPPPAAADQPTETDADLVARVEAEHKAAHHSHKDRPIKAAKAALERIATVDDDLGKRADKLLNLYDLEEPQE